MEDYEKKYKEVLKKIREGLQPSPDGTKISGVTREFLEEVFPELIESEDEKIRKEIIAFIKKRDRSGCDYDYDKWLAWLEKQGEQKVDRDEFAKGVLRGAAIHLMKWIDYHVIEGNMCLSNMECEDIEDAFVNADWDKIYSYLKKNLEKQGEKKPTSDTRYEVKAGDSLSVNGKPFDYEHATITQKDFAPKKEWSEEDENRFQNIIACIEDCYNEKDAQDLIRWFKSLRHQPKQVWSKKDEEMTKELIGGYLSSVSPCQLTHTCKEIADWLKSIKCRMQEKEG